MPEDRPYRYDEVSTLHNKARKTIPFFENASLEEFSAYMNKRTGSQRFSAALNDNIVKQVSGGFDKLLRPLRPVGEAILEETVTPLFGEESRSIAREIGGEMPRSMLEMIPAIRGFSALPRLSGIAQVAGAGLSSGAAGYTATDSPLAGLIQGGLTMATVPFAVGGRKLVQPLIRSATFAPARVRVPVGPAAEVMKTINLPRKGPLVAQAERLLEYTGENLGLAANQELALQGTSIATGQGPSDPTTLEHQVALIGAQIPFAALDVPRLVRGPKAVRTPGQEGRNVDFRSVTEMEEAVKTSNILDASRRGHMARRIDNFLRTAHIDKVLPEVRRAFDVDPQSMAKETVFIAPEVDIQGANVSKYSQAMETLRGKAHIDAPLLAKELKIDPDRAGVILHALERRGLLGPADDKGQRPVLGRTPTDWEFLNQVMRTNFPETPPPAAVPPVAGSGGPVKPTSPTKLAGPEAMTLGAEAKTAGLTIEQALEKHFNADQLDLMTGFLGRDFRVVGSEPPLPQADTAPPGTLQQAVTELRGPGAYAEAITHALSPEETVVVARQLSTLVRAVATSTFDGPKEPIRMMTMDGIEAEGARLLAEGVPGHEVAERMYRMTTADIGRLAAEYVRKGQDGFNAVMSGDDAQTVVTEREKMLRRKVARLVELFPDPAPRPTASDIKRLGDAAYPAEKRPDLLNVLVEVTESFSTRDIVSYEQRELSNKGIFTSYSFIDELYGAAVDYIDQRASTLKKFEATHSELIADMEWDAVDIERKAFRTFIIEKATGRDRTVTTRRREQGLEAAETGVGTIIRAEAADAADAAAMEANSAWIQGNLGEVGGLEWNVAASAAGVDTSRKFSEKLRRFGILLDMVRDGQVGLMPSKAKAGIGYRLVFLEGPGQLRPLELTKLLGFADTGKRAGAKGLEFANQEFLPSLVKLIERRRSEPSADTAPPRPKTRLDTVPEGVLPKEFETLSNNRFNLVAGARSWFQKYYEAAGISQSDVPMLVESATKLAFLFDQVGYTRIANLFDPQYRGLAEGSTVMRAVMLNAEKFREIKDPKLRARQTLITSAHEVTHMRFASNNKSQRASTPGHEEARSWAESMTSMERGEFIRAMYKAEPQYRDRDAEHYAGIVASDPGEFVAHIGAFYALGRIRPSDMSFQFKDGRLALPESAFKMIADTTFVDLRDSLTALQSFMDFAQDRLGSKADLGRHNLGQFFDVLDSGLAKMKGVDDAVQWLRNLEQYEPESFLALMSRDVPTISRAQLGKIFPSMFAEHPAADNVISVARRFVGLDREGAVREFGIQPSFWDRWMAPAAQLAEKFPSMRPAIYGVFGFRSTATKVANQIMAPFMTKRGPLGRMVVDAKGSGLDVVLGNDIAREAVTRISLLKNELNRVMTDAEMEPLLRGLSEADKDSTKMFIRRVEEAMPNAANLIVAYNADKVATAASAIVMLKNREIGHTQALEVGQTLLGIWRKFGGEDQASVITRETALDRLREVYGREAIAAGYEQVTSMMPAVLEMDAKLKDRPWFTPEVRRGRFYVTYVREGEPPGLRAFEKQSEAIAFAERQREEGFNVKSWDKTERDKAESSFHPDIVQSYANIDNAAFESAARKLGFDSATMEEFRAVYSPGAAVLREVKSRGLGKHMLARKLRPGREFLDSTIGIIEYLTGVSHGLAKSYVSERVGLALNDPELRANPALRNLAREHAQTVLNPPTREWAFAKNINFLYFLGANISSMLIETSQPLLTTAPWLTEQTGSLTQSYKAIGGAVSDLIDGMRSGKMKDAELQKAIEKASDEQVLDAGILQEFYELEDVTSANLHGLASGGGHYKDLAALAAKPFYWAGHLARNLYSQSTRLTTRIAFVSAYNTAKAKGMSPDASYEFAVRGARATSFGGGTAARPVGLFARSGKFHGAVGLAYSLQSYTFGAFAMMARFMHDSIRARFKGQDQVAARKAAGQMLLTQVALSGMFGLPMAAGAVKVIEELFGLEMEKDIREAFSALAGGEESGGVFSDIAVNGLMSRVLGADVGARLGLGNAFGVSSYDGMSLGNLVGPFGSVVENAYRGVQNVAQGQMADAAVQVSPRAIKNLVRLYARDEGEVRDRYGRLIMEPTTAEKMWYVAGFNPKRLSDARTKRKLILRSERLASEEQTRFESGLAERMRSGDIEGVREGILTRADNVEGYDPRAGVMRVVDRYLDQVIPADVTRSGLRTEARSREEITGLFPPSERVTEVQRLQMKKRAEQTLGIVTGPPSRMEFTRATMIDQVMATNPNMSRQTAAAVVDRAFRPQRPAFGQSLP